MLHLAILLTNSSPASPRSAPREANAMAAPVSPETRQRTPATPAPTFQEARARCQEFPLACEFPLPVLGLVNSVVPFAFPTEFLQILARFNF